MNLAQKHVLNVPYTSDAINNRVLPSLNTRPLQTLKPLSTQCYFSQSSWRRSISTLSSRQGIITFAAAAAWIPAQDDTTQENPEEEQEDEEEDMEHIEIPDPEHILLDSSFSSVDRNLVSDLRSHYDERFADPLKTSSDRFCWDIWYVPGQYNLIRTPADAFFPADMYDRLENALTEYGERVLGCRGISPIWLSYYVDGCRQELHTDSPHGPWAFVLSLTHWEERAFTGGETMLLQPHVLDFWRGFSGEQGWETPQIQSLIEPHFGQLTVFDPRLPHGVRVVEGTRDPLKARIVLHGWFTAPTPFFSGPISDTRATPTLNAGLDAAYAALAELPPAVGTATVRVHIEADGRVSDVEFLTNTVIPRPQGSGGEHPEDVRVALLGCIAEHMYGLEFDRAMEGGEGEDEEGASVTLPFVFE